MKFEFDYTEPKIIAEIGCNHMGEIDIAKELIDLAKDAGVKYVKFQKHTKKTIVEIIKINKTLKSIFLEQSENAEHLDVGIEHVLFE